MSYAKNWLGFASQDLQVAELVMQEGLFNQVCFHSQQCAEKSLKAWLAKQGKNIPRIHQMADLLTLIPESVTGNFGERLLLLDRFYIPTRYPDALPGSLEDGLPSKNDAEEALGIAREILKWIEEIVQE